MIRAWSQPEAVRAIFQRVGHVLRFHRRAQLPGDDVAREVTGELKFLLNGRSRNEKICIAIGRLCSTSVLCRADPSWQLEDRVRLTRKEERMASEKSFSRAMQRAQKA